MPRRAGAAGDLCGEMPRCERQLLLAVWELPLRPLPVRARVVVALVVEGRLRGYGSVRLGCRRQPCGTVKRCAAGR